MHSKQHLAYTDRSLTNEQVSHVLQKHTTGKQQGTDTKDTVVLNRQAQIKKKKKIMCINRKLIPENDGSTDPISCWDF